jgi:hypothetical protein
MWSAPVFLIAIAVGSTATVSAQQLLRTGDRVRLTSHADRLEGVVTGLTADSVVVHYTKGTRSLAFGARAELTQAFARNDISSIQVARRGSSRAGKGALVGGGIGAGLGFMIGVLAANEESSYFEVGPGEVVAVTAILGGAGALIGTVVGSMSHGTNWEEGWLGGATPVVRLDVGIRAGRVGIGGRLAF